MQNWKWDNFELLEVSAEFDVEQVITNNVVVKKNQRIHYILGRPAPLIELSLIGQIQAAFQKALPPDRIKR